MVQLLDTNIIVRFIIGDDTEQFRIVSDIFRDVKDGSRQVILHEVVISEALYVLEGVYTYTRKESASMLREIFLLQWVANTDKLSLMESLSLYHDTSMDFADCLLIATAKLEYQEILTFDKEMLKYISQK